MALARRMLTDRLCSISRRTAAPSRPCLTAVAVASCFQTAKDSGAHAPEVSATISKKVMPATSHSACVCKWLRLASQYSVAAVRALTAALPTIPCRCGAVMAKSSAAGRPWVQVGRKTSAGRRRVFVVSSGLEGRRRSDFSSSGLQPADLAKLKPLLRVALWRRVRSPPAQHILGW